MINSTIEWVRNKGAWILNPTCLIDRLLDEIEKLSAVLALPVQNAGALRRQAPIEARLDEHLAAQRIVRRGLPSDLIRG